jgi:Phage Tail Collar Domain
MDRTKGAGHVAGQFVAEDLATNRPPTEITAEWLNGVQEELASVIETAGLVLNSAQSNQLLAALRSSQLFITAALTDESRHVATTAFVQQLLASQVSELKVGQFADFATPTPPAGWLVRPVAPTLVAASLYPLLAAAIGAMWGGDGVTTIGLPYCPIGYVDIGAEGGSGGAVGMESVGAVIAHDHSQQLDGPQYGGAWTGVTGYYPGTTGGTATGVTGGAANYAAGIRVLKCVKYM